MAKLAGLPDSLIIDIKDTIVKCFVEESCYEINKIACKAIGGEEKPDKECISFTCEWKSNSVEYGQKSTLSFKWGNIAQEGNCSYAISYKNKPLETTEYTISRATISDLSFLDTTNIVATATVTCGAEHSIVQNCRSLKVKPLPFNFTCVWDSTQVRYGGNRSLSFAFDDQASANLAQKEGCSTKISPLDAGTHLISASTIAGLSYSDSTIVTTKATVTCGDLVIPPKDCNSLLVTPVPGPEKDGKLSFKKSDYTSNDTTYFFKDTKVDSTYINNGIKITNKEEAGCGDIKVRIEKTSTQVRATAVVTCEHIGELELDGISAEILPDPVLGDCKLIGDWDAMMFKKDTLFMSVPIENNYGRCKVQNDTLPLKDYSGKVNDITAKVVCGTTTTNKKCNEEVFVADKFAEIKICDNPRVQIGPGITVVEITCKKDGEPAKNIGCDSPSGDWSANNIFTINGVKAQYGGTWAYAPIPADIAGKESKRVLIEYNKEIGCVAF